MSSYVFMVKIYVPTAASKPSIHFINCIVIYSTVSLNYIHPLYVKKKQRYLHACNSPQFCMAQFLNGQLPDEFPTILVSIYSQYHECSYIQVEGAKSVVNLII